ncbi:MAG: hypothetical protein PHC29_07690 [Candidatus Omnitrophica bacterium]|nr:hypothetical protein [Candidatus Omnitrophota bacterium]
MKIRKRLLKIANARKKEKEKNKNKGKNLSIYNYKFGHKNIKLTVERLEVLKKSNSVDSIFYYSCVFCNKDFDPNVQICPDCGRDLTKINLKKCQHCGAKNNPSKGTCWVCNAPFPKLDEKVDKEVHLLLTLNINNNLYRNTDKILGLGMKKLFEDLITAGFSKEPLEAWVKIHEWEIEHIKESVMVECKNLAREYKRKNLLYIITFILPILICLMIAFVFWVK